MMRAFLTPRPLLLMAAALVALAALFAPGARPAFADHGDTATTVWSATLTVKDTGSSLGCFNVGAGLSYECDTAGVLSDDDFTYGGVNYSVNILSVSIVLAFDLNKTIPDSLKSALTLNIDGRQFPLANANIDGVSAQWSNPGLSWSVDDTIDVSLLGPANPSGVELAGSNLVTSGGGFDLAVTEGASGAFTVRLSSDPGATVTVRLVKTQYNQPGIGKSGHVWDVNAADVSPETLTFTATNFGNPQTVNVTGVEDDDILPEQLIILLFGVGADGENVPVGGSGNSITGVFVTIADDDCNNCSTGVEPVPLPKPEEQQQQGAGKYAELIAQMYEWRNDPQWVSYKSHTDRWDRALLAFGETVSDTSLTPMTASEAQALADNPWGTRWVPVAAAMWELENRAPTVSAALGDVTLINGGPSGAQEVSLSGVFSDADGDDLTYTAASSDGTVALVWITTDQSGVGLLGDYRGTATVTVTADDGKGGTVADTFTVTVKAAPVVASALADVTGLEAEDEQFVLLSGVFTDADGDALTVTAASSNTAAATVSVASDYGTLTVTGVAAGTATVTVTAKDTDGNRVSDAFDVTVVAAPVAQEPDPQPQQEPEQTTQEKYADLIAQMKEWRNDLQWVDHKEHTDRWDRALLAFGETVSDTSLTPMTADEAQGYADKGWQRWVDVAKALRDIEGG